MKSVRNGVPETELCAYSVEACHMAAEAGLTRVELCSAPAEGGLTPSAAMIKAVRPIEGIRLHIMIRPRGGDFLYSDEEFALMKSDIEFARECGADGVVIGLLNADGTVDTARTSELVAAAGDMDVTFHRAFDMTRDLDEALEAVISAGCSRILTSGGCNSAAEGLETLRRLTVLARGRIGIMAGAGVRPANAAGIAAAGVDAVHFSARSRRESSMSFRKGGISMGGGSPESEYELWEADPETMRAIAAALLKK